MSIILNIDTATEKAHVSIAENGIILQAAENALQKNHASFLQSAIQQLMTVTGITNENIDAIACTAGPGSYTGLRVGMASAKGLCYALQKPLIALSTLQVLTNSAVQQLAGKDIVEKVLFCPMIEARRMEVFTAIYNKHLFNILPDSAVVLDNHSFEAQLTGNQLLFFGNGSTKWKTICRHNNALFEEISILPEAMSKLSDYYFIHQQFSSLAYSEPFYVKGFQNHTKN